MSLVFGLVVGGVKIVDAAFEASLHDCEILIGERHIDYDIWLVAVEKLAELLYGVGINRVSDNIVLADGGGDGVAFAFGA